MRLTAEQREAVFLVDGYRCVAPIIDSEAGPCRDFFGEVITHRGPMNPYGELTVEHVVPDYGRMGRRAANDIRNMTTLCWGHHLGHGVTGQGGSIWALAHKADVRSFLAQR